MLGGDEEEHATLLCNYFLFCGFKAWVLLGHAVPEGRVKYCIVNGHESRHFLWLSEQAAVKHSPH